ncbi:MAG: TetR/AcrR family transcriptional regulator [Leptolyngbya sp. BL-A-14]
MAKPLKHQAQSNSQGRTPGRPRSELARQSILQASYKLLQEKPIESISTQQIAAAAGVSTATLYRWWDTKEAVLLDAFLEAADQHLPFRSEIDSPLERLREHARQGVHFLLSEDGRIMAKLIMAIQDNEGLRQVFLAGFYEPRRNAARQVIRDAITASELPSGTDVETLIDGIYGPLYFRLFLGHQPLNESFALQAFQLAVTGARYQTQGAHNGSITTR